MNKNIDDDELKNEKYSKAYSEDSFWDKIKTVALKVGAKGIYYALILYYILQKDEVSYADKALILAALGYFIFPIDLIPDMLPFIGYTDDIGALLIVLGRVSMYIDREVKRKAKEKLQDWFSISDSEIENLLEF